MPGQVNNENPKFLVINHFVGFCTNCIHMWMEDCNCDLFLFFLLVWIFVSGNFKLVLVLGSRPEINSGVPDTFWR